MRPGVRRALEIDKGLRTNVPEIGGAAHQQADTDEIDQIAPAEVVENRPNLIGRNTVGMR